MPKQVGSRNGKSLLRQAAFDSFSKLYYTHFVLSQSQTTFGYVLCLPSSISYSTVQLATYQRLQVTHTHARTHTHTHARARLTALFPGLPR